MKGIKALYKKTVAALALFTIELILVSLIFSLSLLTFYLVWDNVIQDGHVVLDELVFAWIDSWQNPTMTWLMSIVTFLGNREFVVTASVLLIIYFLFIRKHKWYSLKIPVVALGCVALNLILKNVIGRPRPKQPLIEAFGLSFPSGHAMMAFSFYGLIIYLAWRNISNRILRYSVCILLFILIHVIAFSRVYLRVHFTSDVLAGLALGAAWLVLSIYVLRKMEKYSSKKIEPVLEN